MKTLNVHILAAGEAKEARKAALRTVHGMNRLFAVRGLKWNVVTMAVGPRFSAKTALRRCGGPGLYVFLPGGPDDVVRVRPLLQELHASDGVRVMGCVPHRTGHDVADLWDPADGLLLTVADTESLGLFLLGALRRMAAEAGFDCPLRVDGRAVTLDNRLLLDTSDSLLPVCSLDFYLLLDKQKVAARRLAAFPESPDNIHDCRDLERAVTGFVRALLSIACAAAYLPAGPDFAPLHRVLRSVSAYDFGAAAGQLADAAKSAPEPRCTEHADALLTACHVAAGLMLLRWPSVANPRSVCAVYLKARKRLEGCAVSPLPAGTVYYEAACYAAEAGHDREAALLAQYAAEAFRPALSEDAACRLGYIAALRRQARVLSRRKADYRSGTLYTEALTLARKGSDRGWPGFPAAVAGVLVDNAMYLKQRRPVFETEADLSEALLLYRILQAGNPAYKLRVGRTLVRLSDLLCEDNRFEESEDCVYEAVQIFHELNRCSNVLYLKSEVEQLCHLAHIHYNMGLVENARSDLSMAIDLYMPEAMITADGLQDLAHLYTSYAYMSVEMCCYEEALEIYRIAYRLYSGMDAVQPDRYTARMEDVMKNIRMLEKRLR